MEITERYLPVQCYSSLQSNYEPRLLRPLGVVFHWYSCKWTKPNDPFNFNYCWQQLHDLNFDPANRKFNIYNGKKVHASYHFLISRNGIIQRTVPEQYIAYHAGKSEFMGMNHCNDFMFGAAMIGKEGIPFTREQYDAVIKLSGILMDQYVFDSEWLTGHDQVAIPLGRKPDPGELFDYDRLRQGAENEVKRINGELQQNTII